MCPHELHDLNWELERSTKLFQCIIYYGPNQRSAPACLKEPYILSGVVLKVNLDDVLLALSLISIFWC